ncbi:MAG: ribosome-associated translation inhibitor RaiA [Flavobacteriaceae bacterium]|nr:ribosome-associated translation inhibitor RaiA [Flavobacteriaceae bacterium]
MKVNVHAVNFNVDGKLVGFIQERTDRLEKYYDKIISSDVFLKVKKTSEKENKIVEIKMLVPGDEFMVKKECKTFEEAIEQSAESLERLLTKRKEKVKHYI